MIALAGAGVLALVLGGLWWAGWPTRGPTIVYDRTGMVSLQVPAGWTATTPHDARRFYAPLVGGPYQKPGDDRDAAALRLSANDHDSDASIEVYLDTRWSDSLAELHRADLNTSGLVDHATVIESPVAVPRSMASVGPSAGRPRMIVTILSEWWVVSVFASADDEDGLRAARDVVRSLALS